MRRISEVERARLTKSWSSTVARGTGESSSVSSAWPRGMTSTSSSTSQTWVLSPSSGVFSPMMASSATPLSTARTDSSLSASSRSTETPGWEAMKSASSRGRKPANAELLAHRRNWPVAPLRKSSMARARCSSRATTSTAWWYMLWPAGVGVTPRLLRTSRVTPQCCSSSATRLLAAASDSPSVREPAVRLPASTTATYRRSVSRSKRWRLIIPILHQRRRMDQRDTAVRPRAGPQECAGTKRTWRQA